MLSCLTSLANCYCPSGHYNVIDNITELEPDHFINCPYIKSVYIPPNVLHIGTYAFSNCEHLSNVTLSSGLRSLGQGAFEYCISLKYITIPDTLGSIGVLAFRGCSGLINIFIQSYISSIFSSAFEGCSSLKSLNHPINISTIGKNTFSGCSSLESLIIEEGTIRIYENAFNSCSSLKSISIPSTVKHIKNGAFGGCTSLQTITLPDGITNIYEYTFYGCTSLVSINMPLKSLNIYNNAFEGCTSLSCLRIQTIKSLDTNAFYGCNINELIFESQEYTILKDEYYYSNITRVAFNFRNQISNKRIREDTKLPSLTHFTNLKYVKIENINDLSIPEYFIGNNEVEIFISNNVSSIDENAFKNCSISKFTYYGTEEIKGDFLKNARSCKEVITTVDYKQDQLGGITITQKIKLPDPEQEDTKTNNTSNETDTGFRTDTPSGMKEGKGKLGGGAIAGIVLGVILFITIIAIVLFFVFKNKSSNQNNETSQNCDEENP
ncbi:surface antigen BspA-like [Trichomonas vaginalis G3]|uniref:Surface antigen BspA-like n=1 Tax=Trichomonas vaginalis (strain ATCC PRA-98 / G3) TaxID=412133 RepID=A2G5X5_TRIV3|nr:surface antigen family [Trichomonas vaginalis G3]EAX87445.1 surface antigen BspA-like [Trichomonas vaginalis G3]KAI5553771.1 surface antigen family [Trichomonas vaginalis G3]|eukprot:XP_001300375.1 surface antigen BspA-like [Trichomonas vaginalis G3]